MDPALYIRIAYSLLTLYMMLILLRWFGPAMSMDFAKGRLVWIARLTDPLISRLRKLLPNMGPIDFGPLAALVLVLLVRILLIGFLQDIARRG